MAKDATRDHSGGGDPARSLALLWRNQAQRPVRNGRRDLSVDRIVSAAIEVADADGVAALSMRRVAEKLPCPFISATSAGKVACGSLLVKWTTPL